MLRRKALLSLLAAPLAWLGRKRPVRYYQVYVNGTPDPWGETTHLRPGDWIVIPAGMTPEQMVREYYESNRTFLEMNQGISSHLKGEADGTRLPEG